MALQSGRVGVAADQVDVYGRIKGGGPGPTPSGGNIYSKEETVVGTFDGKPLYRKIIEVGDITWSTFTKLLDIEVGVCNMTFFNVKKDNDHYIVTNPLMYLTSSDLLRFNVVVGTDNKPEYYATRTSTSINYTDCTIVLEYTKLND